MIDCSVLFYENNLIFMIIKDTKSLKDIIKPVESELDEFKIYFDGLLRSDIKLLNLITKYMRMKHGKMVRPALVFLTAKMLGTIDNRAFVGAGLVELLHTATLVHDDVVDESDERRGLASINAKWGNKVAVLLGDFMLAQGLLSAIDAKEYIFLDAASSAVRRMSQGELHSIQKARESHISVDEYFSIISDKTAALLSACSHIGALSVTSDTDLHERLLNYGEYIGIAFQIRDDVLDYISTSFLIGKPVGNDIKEKKITLPLIYTLEKIPLQDAKAIVKRIRKGKLSKKEIREIIELTIESGGTELAMKKATEYADKAIECLGTVEHNIYKQSLIDLANFVVERSK